ncbi:MAG: VCBS repeat-containing protein [Planctomycetota bacterium]
MSLTLGLLWTNTAVGDDPLFPGVQYAAGDRPESIAIDNLNGDQIPDLVAANRDGDCVSVLLGVSDGTFAAAADYATGSGPCSVAIGDLNGDQVPDLAVANASSDNISVLLHQRSELFPDCNGDGILDVCDLDCGPAGGPCDVPGCGESWDCNGNGVPDECEPGGHNCCNDSHGAGCNNPDVEACVCAIDPYCCEVYWDRLCVEEVETLGCGACDNDCDGSGVLDECEPEYADIGLFIGQLLAVAPDPVLACMFDQNGDATLDGADIQGFVDMLLSL